MPLHRWERQALAEMEAALRRRDPDLVMLMSAVWDQQRRAEGRYGYHLTGRELAWLLAVMAAFVVVPVLAMLLL
jgi:hypothetical protein